MKKLTYLFFAIMSLFLVTACGGNFGGNPDTGGNGGDIVEPEKDICHVTVYGFKDEVINKLEVKRGDKLTKEMLGDLEAPNGFKFKGWSYDLSKPVASDLEIFAIFEECKYHISFITGTDELLDSVEVVVGDIVPLPELHREGYIFEGFEYMGEIYHKEIYFKFEADITLTAVWSAKPVEKIKINYISDDHMDNELNPKEAELNEKIYLHSPDRKGYYFLGWYLEPDFKTKVDYIVVTHEINTVYAKFTDGSDIAYHLDGGTNAYSNPEHLKDGNSHTLAPAEKEGYYFLGWWDNEEFSGKPITEIKGMMPQDINLYARFTKNKLKLTINLNDKENNKVVLELLPGEFYNLYDSVNKPGYSLDKVTIDGENMPLAGKFEYYEDITVEASFSPALNHILYMDFENSYGYDNPNPSNYLTGEELSLLPATMEGYSFDGWYKEKEFTNKIEKITSDMIGQLYIYPKFIPNTYKITYDYPDNIEAINPNPTELTYPGSIELKGLEVEGYRFMGWYLDGERVYTITPNKDLTIVARLEVITVTITYYRADNTTEQFEATYGEPIVIPEITHPGYKINGYAIDGIEYKEGEPSRFVRDSILKLIEEPIAYKINYHLEPNMTLEQGLIPTEFTVEDASIELPACFINAVRFNGYALSKTDETNTILTISPQKTLHDVDLYPVFGKTTYNITLANGADRVELTVSNNEELILPKPENIPAGYVFDYWEYDGMKFAPKYYPFTDDIIITAKFKVVADQQLKINYHLPEGAINHKDNPEFITGLNEMLKPAYRPGFSFTGWYLNENCTTSTNLVAENLYPDFIPLRYNIRFRYNNMILLTRAIYSAEAFDLSTVSFDGYTINGFYLDGKEFSCDSYNYASDITVDVALTLNKYKISYNLNGGTAPSMPTEYNATSLIRLSAAKKRGYSFDGWFDESNQEVNLIDGQKCKKDYTLTAKFSIIKYHIEYEPLFTYGKVYQYTVLDEIILPKVTELNNDYEEFEGWYLNGVRIEKIEKGTIGDLTLVAKFVPGTYHARITSRAEGYEPVEFDYQIRDRISDKVADPSIRGYKFVGYSFEGEIITYMPPQAAGGVELEAVFELNTFKIIYMDSHGDRFDINGNPTSYTVEDHIVLKPLIYEGLEFTYFTDDEGNIVNEIKNSIGDIILYGNTEGKRFLVTVNYNDGSDEVVLQSSAFPLSVLKTPKREGYCFLGFVEVRPDGNVFIGEHYVISSDVRIEAMWAPSATYKITLNATGLTNNKLVVSPGEEVRLPRLKAQGNTVFTGWSYNDGTKTLIYNGEFIFRYTSDITLNPVFVDNTLDFEYIENSADVYIKKYIGSSKTIFIPNLINNKPVTYIYMNLVDKQMDAIYLGENVKNTDQGALNNFKYINLNKKFKPMNSFITRDTKELNVTIELSHNFDLFYYMYGPSRFNIVVNYDSSFDNCEIYKTLLRTMQPSELLSLKLRGFKTLNINDIIGAELLDEELLELTGTNERANSKEIGRITVQSINHWVNVKKSDILDQYELYIKDKLVDKVVVDKEIIDGYALSGLVVDTLEITNKANSIGDYALANMDINTFMLESIVVESLGATGSYTTYIRDVYYSGSADELYKIKGSFNYSFRKTHPLFKKQFLADPKYEYDLIDGIYVYNLIIKKSEPVILNLEKDFNGKEIRSLALGQSTARLEAKVLILNSLTTPGVIVNSIEDYLPSIRLVIGTSLGAGAGEDPTGGVHNNGELLHEYVDPAKLSEIECKDYNGYRLLSLPNGSVYVIDVLEKKTSYDLGLDLEKAPYKVNKLAPKIFNSFEVDELTIPGSIKVVPYLGVAEGHGLRKLVLEEGVEVLAKHAFIWTLIDDLYLPRSMKAIHMYGAHAKRVHVNDIYSFAEIDDCIGLFSREAIDGGLYVNNERLTELVFSYNTHITPYKFRNIPGITRVVFNYPVRMDEHAIELDTLKTIEVNSFDTWQQLTAFGVNIFKYNKAKFILAGKEVKDVLEIPDNIGLHKGLIVPEMGIKSLRIMGSVVLTEPYMNMGITDVYIEDLNKYLASEVRSDDKELYINNGVKLYTKNVLGEYEILKKLEVNEALDIKSLLFSGYMSLVELVINSKVNNILENAFIGCDSLLRITTGSQGELVNIGPGAFKGLKNLKICNLNGTKVISDNAFNGCSSLELKLPATITNIGSKALSGTRIGEFEINHNLAQVAKDAFNGSKLHKVIIREYSTIGALNRDSFHMTNPIEVVLGEYLNGVPYEELDAIPTIAHFDIKTPGFTAYNKEGRYLHGIYSTDLRICHYTTSGTEIPKEANEIKDISTADVYYNGSYEEFKSITNYSNIYGRVNYIGADLSYNISYVDGVLYQAINDKLNISISDTTLKLYDFRKYSDKQVELIGPEIKECDMAEVVYLPNGLALADTFNNHKHIKEVTLPEGLIEIPKNMFYRSTIEVVNWPKGLKKIGEYAFGYCKGIKKLTLPEGLEALDRLAFTESSIEELTVPSTLKSYGYEAFYQTKITRLNVSSLDEYIKSDFASGGNPAGYYTKFYVNGVYQSFFKSNSGVKSDMAFAGAFEYAYLDSSIDRGSDHFPNETTILTNGNDSYNRIHINDVNSLAFCETENFKYIKADNKCFGLMFTSSTIQNIHLYDKFDGLELATVHENVFVRASGIKAISARENLLPIIDSAELEINNPGVVISTYDKLTYKETANISYIERLDLSTNKIEIENITIINPELEIYSEAYEIADNANISSYSYSDDAFIKAPKLKLVYIKDYRAKQIEALYARGILILASSGYDHVIGNDPVTAITRYEDDLIYYDLGGSIFIDSLINKNAKEIDLRALETKLNGRILNIPSNAFNNLTLDKLVFTDSIKYFGDNILTGSTVTYFEMGCLKEEEKLGEFIAIDTLCTDELSTEKLAKSVRKLVLKGFGSANLYNSESIRELYVDSNNVYNASLPNLEYLEAMPTNFKELIGYNPNLRVAKILNGYNDDRPMPESSIEVLIVGEDKDAIGRIDIDVRRFKNLKVVVAPSHYMLNGINDSETLLAVIQEAQLQATDRLYCDVIRDVYTGYKIIENEKFKYLSINDKYAYLLEWKDKTSVSLDLDKELEGLNIRGIHKHALDGALVEELVLPGTLNKLPRELLRKTNNLKRVIFPDAIENINFVELKNLDYISMNIHAISDLSDLTVKTLELTGTVNEGEALEWYDTSFREIDTLNISAENAKYIKKLKCARVLNITSGTTLELTGDIEVKELRICEALTDILRVPIKSIERLDFPSNLKRIHQNAFEYTTIKEINLPDGVEEIGAYAFNGSRVERATIPGSVRVIGERAFANSELRALYLGDGILEIKADAFDAPNLSLLRVPASVNILETQTSFDGILNIRRLSGFEGYHLYSNSQIYMLDKNVVMTEELKNALTTKNVYYEDARDVSQVSTDKYSYLETDTKLVYNLTLRGFAKEYNIPADLPGLRISEITASRQLYGTIKLYLPEGLRSIRVQNYLSANEIHLANMKQIAALRIGRFISDYTRLYVNDQELTDLVVEDIEVVKENTFAGIKSLNSVTIGKGVREVEAHAFDVNLVVNRVIVLGNVETIRDYAFSDECKEMAIIKSGVKSIGTLEAPIMAIPRSVRNMTQRYNSYRYYYEGSRNEFYSLGYQEIGNIYYDTLVDTIEHIATPMYSYDLINGTEAYNLELTYTTDGIFKENHLGDGIVVKGISQYGFNGVSFKEFHSSGLKESLRNPEGGFYFEKLYYNSKEEVNRDFVGVALHVYINDVEVDKDTLEPIA